MSRALNDQHIYPDEIELLTEIKDRILKGHSRNEIAEDFTKRKIPTRHIDGQRWTAKTIGSIISNPIYAGVEITNKSEEKYNSILETKVVRRLPPDKWKWEMLPEYSIYRIWTVEEFIALQKN